MWPFMAAGLIVAYGINAGANAMMACTDPYPHTQIESPNYAILAVSRTRIADLPF